MASSSVRLVQRARTVLVLLLAAATALMTTVGAGADQGSQGEAAGTSLEAPKVIPALDNWTPQTGNFHFGERSRILFAANDPRLRQTARTLAEDLADLYGGSVPVELLTTPQRAGDVILTIDPDRDELSDEGYEMVVDDVLRITGATDDGVFYGTRTLVQLLTTSRDVPKGRTVDVPRYPERGLEVCPCAIKISMPWLERLMKDMAYLKLNYLLLPLKVESDSHPEINQWSYYTKDEARQIADWAEKYHVTAIPEINAPSHMEPFLFDRPDLQLTDPAGNRSATRMDITNPEAFDFYTDLIDEQLEIFPGPYWDMGADEYLPFSLYANYPQFGEYVRSKFGPDAVPADAFIDFINRVDEYVQSKGRTLRIWNDGLSHETTVPLNRDVVIEHWVAGEVTPSELLDAGRTVMNASNALYYDSGYGLHSDYRQLWDSGWDPGQFDGSQVDPETPGLSGAHLSLWQSIPSGATENQVERDIFMPLRFIAQRTWGSTEPFVSYDTFTAWSQALGHAPGWSNVDYRPLPDTTYTIRAGADPRRGILAAKYSVFGSKLIAGSSEAQWQLRHTDDGYYRIVSPATGLCMNMRVGSLGELQESAPGVGAAVTMEACDGGNTQKWEIVQTEQGADFTVTNAISQMVLDVADDGTVVQLPPDQASDSLWRFEIQAHTTVDVDAPAELLVPGQANEVTATFTNHWGESVTDVTLGMDAPEGWQVQPGSGETFGSVPAGESVTATFAVTPPADASPTTGYVLTAQAAYTVKHKSQSVSGSTIVHTNPIGCTDPPGAPVEPSDEFNGDKLDGCRWTEVQDPDLTAMAVADGRLHIQTQEGDLLGGPPDVIKNLLLQEAPGGDWTLEIKMDAQLEESYQQAGLMVYGDDDNFVEFVLVSQNPPGAPPNLYFSLGSEQDAVWGVGAVNVFNPAGDADDIWWMRLSKMGDTYSGAYSADGDTWTAMPGEVVNGSIADPKVGLFATGPLQQSSTSVSFDYFHLASNGTAR